MLGFAPIAGPQDVEECHMAYDTFAQGSPALVCLMDGDKVIDSVLGVVLFRAFVVRSRGVLGIRAWQHRQWMFQERVPIISSCVPASSVRQT